MSRAAAPTARRPGQPAPTSMVVRGAPRYNVQDHADPVGKVIAAAQHARQYVVGRQVVTDLVELAMLAGSNCLLFGPPGTAKTLAVDIMTSCIEGAHVFSTLLTKFSKPAEVFGPIDLEAFKRGKLKARTAGYLPAATVGVIDEVFKGSSAILNSLLSIANERRFFDDGEWLDTPTRMLVGMSNELPEDATLLAAFYDRFPLKYWAEYLDEGNFSKMLGAPRWSKRVAPPVTITAEDFAEIDRRVNAVVVPPDVLRAVEDIRRLLTTAKIVASDRRYIQAVRIIKASAVRRGVEVATTEDVRPLRYILWNEPAQAAKVAEIVAEFVAPMGKAIKEQLQELAAARGAVIASANAAGSDPSTRLAAAVRAASQNIGAVRNIAARLEALAKSAQSTEAEVCALAAAAARAFTDSAHALAAGDITFEQFVNRTETDLTIDLN